MTSDYRLSHLHRGAFYDHQLNEEPFDAYMADREAVILGQLLKRLFPHGVDRYLDFACGTGRVLSALEGSAAQAYGVDVSDSMLAQAERRCRHARLVNMDITQQAFPVRGFNLITAFRFFGNAQDGLRAAVLQALHDLLADDGYLILNNHRNPRAIRNLIARDPDLDLSHTKLQHLLAEAGFRVVTTHSIGTWVIRDRLNSKRVLQSRWAQALETLASRAFLTRWSPDAIIVARKTGRPSA